MKTQKQVDRYLDAPATRREVLNAIEQLIAAHNDQHHTSGARKLLNRLAKAARRMKLSIREARNA
jgi:beta-lactamase superfamily II metal-dependent hydrolase